MQMYKELIKPIIRAGGTYGLTEEEKKIKMQQMTIELLRRVPLETRLRSVYIPLMVTDVAMDLAGAVRGILVASAKEKAKRYAANEGDKKMKATLRELKDVMENYDRALYNDIGGKLYKVLKDDSAEMFEEVKNDIAMWQMQFSTLLLKFDIDRNLNDLMAYVYVVRELHQYKIDFEREMDRFFTESLKGSGVNYEGANSHYMGVVDKCMGGILALFGLPGTLENEYTKRSRAILENRVDGMNFSKHCVQEL